MQSVVTISSRGTGASTTYLTGSLTTVVRSVVWLDPHRFAAGGGRDQPAAGAAGGAVLGGWTLRVAAVGAPTLAAALVVGVIAFAIGLTQRARTAAGRSQPS